MLDIKKLIEEARSEAENFRSFDEDDKPLEKGDLTGIANLIDNLCDQLEKHPLEVQVDGVQTHNAEDAIKSAWGRDVSISGTTLGLK